MGVRRSILLCSSRAARGGESRKMGRDEGMSMGCGREISSFPDDPCHGKRERAGIKGGGGKHLFGTVDGSSLRVNASECGKVQQHPISRVARVAPEQKEAPDRGSWQSQKINASLMPSRRAGLKSVCRS